MRDEQSSGLLSYSELQCLKARLLWIKNGSGTVMVLIDDVTSSLQLQHHVGNMTLSLRHKNSGKLWAAISHYFSMVDADSVSQTGTTSTTNSQLGCGTSCSQSGCQGSRQSACGGDEVQESFRQHDPQFATGTNVKKTCVKCKSKVAQVSVALGSSLIMRFSCTIMPARARDW